MAYSNYDVAHAWAHNLDKMHNGSSVYHEDGCFLSYSTCIAQRIEVNGKVAYILNDARYSSSTCKHQSAAYGAVPVGAVKFRCGFANWGNHELISTWHYGSDIEENNKRSRIRFGMRYIMDELAVCLEMKTARKLNTSVTRHGYNELKRWLEFTGDTTIAKLLRLTVNEFGCYIPTYTDYYSYQRHAKWTETPALLKKFLKLLHSNASIEEICDAINGKGTYAAWNKRQQSIRKAQETFRKNTALHKEKAEQRRKKEAEAYSYTQRIIAERGDEGRRDLWHEGYNVSVRFTSLSLYYGGNVLLRVKGNIVETSKGIKIPKSECKRLWTIISRWHNNAIEFIAGEHVNATMSSFTVSRYQNDIMIAGCHAIAYKEMESVARKLGFI